MVDAIIRIKHALGLISDGSEPGQVTGLVSTFTTGTFVDLQWNAEANAASYNIYQDGVRIANTVSTTFRVTGLDPETSYDFQVASTDSTLILEGPRSTVLEITTPALPEWTGVPFPLFDLGVAATFDLKAFIRPAPTAGYTFSSIGTDLPSGVTLNGGTGVLTYDGVGGISDASTFSFRYNDNLNPVTDITGVRIQVKDDTVPTVPTNLQSASITPATFTLSWDASTDPGGNLSGYKVWRNGVLWEDVGNVTSFDVSGQAEGSTNLWRVSAYDNAGNESPLSAGLNVTHTTSGLVFVTPNPSFLSVIPNGAGFGTSTSGGAGRETITNGFAAAPTIYFVTNLNLSGAGSLKAALMATGRRIIIPCVSGLIDYSAQSETTSAGNGRNILIGSGQMTYWGQCAPAPGLYVRGANVSINTNNARDLVFWHLPILQDIYDDPTALENNADCFGVQGSTSGIVNADIICAYCTFMHSSDELMDCFYGANNITFFSCIFAEPIHATNHPKGPHGYGPLFTNRRHDCKAAILRCYFAHCYTRNPATAAHYMAYADNVVYNPVERGMQLEGRESEGQPDPRNNIEQNVFIRGPNTFAATPIHKADGSGNTYPAGAQHWLTGNRVHGSGWSDAAQTNLLGGVANGTFVAGRIAEAWPNGYNTTSATNRDEKVRLVMRHVGAYSGIRIPHIARVCNHVEATLTGVGVRGALINHPNDWGGWFSVANNTVNHTQGADPIPGITTQSSTPTLLGADGCFIRPSGYTTLEEWGHRRHVEKAAT